MILSILLFCKEEKLTKREPMKAQKRSEIIFLGDSLTAGFGLAISESYPSLIQKQTQDYIVVNGGRSGDTTAGGLSRIDWYLNTENKIHSFIIALGSNDALRGLPIKVMEENLTKIIDLIRKRDNEIKIFLIQMKTLPNMGATYGQAYEKVFSKVTKTKKIILLPFMLKAVAGHPELNQPDGIHPNIKGMEQVANNIWHALLPHL